MICMSWEKILGQEKAKELLQGQIKSGKISHAYLFIGPQGVGKRFTAEIFAQALNCTDELNKPCGKCRACKQILHGNSSYVNYFTTPGKIKIEHVRSLCKYLNYKTEQHAAQVIIIDGADKMTPDAANNLLKTLEEPPIRTHFILLAEEKIAMLPTIISRCQPVLFTPLATDQVAKYLQEKYKLPYENTVMLAKITQGSIEKAERVAKDEEFQLLRTKAQEIFDFCPQDAYDILKLSKQLSENKDQLAEILDMLRLLIRDALVFKAGAQELIINMDMVNVFADKDYSMEALLYQYEKVEEATRRLRANANRKLTIDAMLLAVKLDRRKSAW